MLNIASRHFLSGIKKKKEDTKSKKVPLPSERGAVPSASITSRGDPGTRFLKDFSHFSPINAVGMLEISPGKPAVLLRVGFGFVEAPLCLQVASALHLTSHRTLSP